MDKWMKAMETLQKVKDVKDKLDDVEKVRTLGENLLKKKQDKLEPKDFKLFANEDLGGVTTAIDKVVQSLDKIGAQKWEPPEPEGTDEAYGKMLKAAYDSGDKDSKEVKKAAATWGKLCSVFRDQMIKASVPIRVAKAELPTRLAAAVTGANVATKLEAVLEKCMKIPTPGGTAQQAEFFEMYVQAGEIVAGFSKIESRLIEIQKTNLGAYDELKEMMEQNDKWIAYAAKASGQTKEQLAKNAKAKVPR